MYELVPLCTCFCESIHWVEYLGDVGNSWASLTYVWKDPWTYNPSPRWKLQCSAPFQHVRPFSKFISSFGLTLGFNDILILHLPEMKLNISWLMTIAFWEVPSHLSFRVFPSCWYAALYTVWSHCQMHVLQPSSALWCAAVHSVWVPLSDECIAIIYSTLVFAFSNLSRYFVTNTNFIFHYNSTSLVFLTPSHL